MYLSAMCYAVIFYPLHLYVFVLICQYYVVLLERTNKDIILLLPHAVIVVDYNYILNQSNSMTVSPSTILF